MNYLRRLFSRFKKSSEPAATNSVTAVSADEVLARFLFSKRHFSRKDGRILPDAYMPPPGVKPLQTSTYRIATLSDDEAWQLGQAVRGNRAESLKARADISASVVLTIPELLLVPTSVGITVSPQLHVDIMGWPDLPDAQRMLATEIAASASLNFPPSS